MFHNRINFYLVSMITVFPSLLVEFVYRTFTKRCNNICWTTKVKCKFLSYEDVLL